LDLLPSLPKLPGTASFSLFRPAAGKQPLSTAKKLGKGGLHDARFLAPPATHLHAGLANARSKKADHLFAGQSALPNIHNATFRATDAKTLHGFLALRFPLSDD